MTRKRQNCQEIDTFSRRRFTSLLSPSREPSRARPQFLRARLLATVIEGPEEEVGKNYLTIRPVAHKGYGSIAHEAKPNGLLTRGP